MNKLPEKHFERGPKITLPGINEDITLPKHALFRYDGAVSSLAENIARTQLIIRGVLREDQSIFSKILNWPIDQLAISHRTDSVKLQVPDMEKNAAYCYAHHFDMNTLAYVIAKRSNLAPNVSVFADGYQSGELLNKLEQSAELQKIINKIGSIDLPVAQFKTDLGDIGGLVALHKHNSSAPQKLEPPVFQTRSKIKQDILSAFGF